VVDVTVCNGATGQYVTVENTDRVITICELAVMAVPAAGAGGSVSTDHCYASVTAMDSLDGWETYQLSCGLTGGAANIYTIFGDSSTTLTAPAAYQEAAPFGANTGGVSPAFVAVSATAAVDSWLTVGITDGDTAGAISSIGIEWDTWTADVGLSTDNGAVFWMVPDNGPSGSAVVAQVTVAAGSGGTVTMGAQGRSASGDDWSDAGILFALGGGGGGGSSTGGVNCDATVTAMDSLDGWETYQLGLTLNKGAA
jgi:hypothetical protein